MKTLALITFLALASFSIQPILIAKAKIEAHQKHIESLFPATIQYDFDGISYEQAIK